MSARSDLVRRRVNDTLSSSAVSDSTIDYKQAVAEQYGRIYKTQPAQGFLENVLADIDDLQVLTGGRLTTGQRRDLCTVTARLAGLVSMTMVNLGCYRQAREWVHTARLAADEAGQPGLRAWVATRAAVASLHLGDAPGAIRAAREAELLTHARPQPVTAMAWAIVARAAAMTEDNLAARSALRHAEDLFKVVEIEKDNTAYAFTAGQLHFYRSHALTTIGETGAAWVAQDDALAAFGSAERLDPTLVHLDRALCLVRDGDVVGGADYASGVLRTLSEPHRPVIVIRRARAVADAIPVACRSTPVVRALQDVLAISVSPAAADPS
jgi:hypothetical protein